MSAFQPHPQASRKVANPRQQNPHSTRTHTVMTTTATATHAVRQQNRPQQQRLRRKKLVFGWIQDVSGSMSGNRIEASLQGFDHMFEEVCQPTDYLGVVTYNGDLNTLHLPMQVQKIDASRDKAGIRKGLQGNTAYDRMYDAVGSSIRGLQAMAKDERYSAVTDDAVYQLLLLTDGGDNYSSEFTLATLTELVAHPGLPNFHLVVVAVSMSERDKQKLRGLCAPVHATFLDVKNFSDLQHTLHEVGEVVQQRLVFTTTTVTQTRTVMQGHSTGGAGSVQTITEGLAATRLHSLPYQPVTRTLVQKQPQKQKQNRTPRMVTNGANICQHFLTGTCVFGKKCRNEHPTYLLT